MTKVTKIHCKVVVVTGAASGMGRLAASRYASAGKTVIALDINTEGLKQLCSEFNNIYTYVVDITDYRQVSERIEKVLTEHGQIDRLVHCAGIMPLQKISEQDVEVIHRIIDINYKGTVNINKAILPSMQARGAGQIVNFASIAGWVPCLYFGAYDASKFAVVAFSEVLAQEVKSEGIQVTCVCPPPVNTPMLNGVNFSPKMLKYMETVEAEDVLKAMEKSVNKGELFCYPGKLTYLSILIRRLVPSLPWWINQRVEKV